MKPCRFFKTNSITPGLAYSDSSAPPTTIVIALPGPFFLVIRKRQHDDSTVVLHNFVDLHSLVPELEDTLYTEAFENFHSKWVTYSWFQETYSQNRSPQFQNSQKLLWRQIHEDGILVNKTVSRSMDTKNICSFRVQICGFMQVDREVIAKVFPNFQSSEPLTSFKCTVFTGSIHRKTNLLLLYVWHYFTR